MFANDALQVAERPRIFRIEGDERGALVVRPYRGQAAQDGSSPKAGEEAATHEVPEAYAAAPYQVMSPEWEAEEVSATAMPMDDGFNAPGLPAGLAVFEGQQPGQLVVMSNHAEGVRLEDLSAESPVPSADLIYSQSRMDKGAVVRLVIDASEAPLLQLQREELVLAGTSGNIGGAATPWGTFLSAAQGDSQLFELNPHGKGLAAPVPVVLPRRLAVAAVAVDADNQMIYLAEAGQKGRIYRFQPSMWGNLSLGGRLSVLAIATQESKLPLTAPARAWWVILPENNLQNNIQHDDHQGVELGEMRGMVVKQGSLVITLGPGSSGNVGQMLLLQGGFLLPYPMAAGQESPVLPGAMALTADKQLWVCEENSEKSRLLVEKPAGGWEPVLWVRQGALSGVGASPEGRYVFVNLQLEGKLLVLKKK